MMPAAAWPHPVDPYRPAPRAPKDRPGRHPRARRRDRPADADVALTIRRAGPADAGTLTALAALDSARPLEGEVLLALQDDRPVAALELSGGRAIADPFRRTEEALSMLEVRARQLSVAAAARDSKPVHRTRATSRTAHR